MCQVGPQANVHSHVYINIGGQLCVCVLKEHSEEVSNANSHLVTCNVNS